MKSNIWALLVLLIIAGVLLSGVNLAYDESSEPNAVDAESVTLAHDEPVAVANADIAHGFDANITVINTTNGTELADSEYEWNDSAGTITALNSSDDNETVAIDYTYHAPNETARGIASVLAFVNPTIAYGLVLFIGLGVVLKFASSAGGT